MLEGRHDAGGGERPALGRYARRRIKAYRPLRVGGVEVTHIVDAGTWDGVESVEREVTVRINDRDPLPCEDVAHREVVEKRGLAATTLADRVEMPLSFLAREHDA